MQIKKQQLEPDMKHGLVQNWKRSTPRCCREEANSDSMLETVSLTCFYYYNHTQWFACRILPICLTVTKVPLFSSWRDSLSLTASEYKKLTHSFWRLDITLEMFCKTEDPFILLPHCISLSIQHFDFSSCRFSLTYKRTWHRGPNKMVILPSSLSAGSPIKVSSLLQQFISRIH